MCYDLVGGRDRLGKVFCGRGAVNRLFKVIEYSLNRVFVNIRLFCGLSTKIFEIFVFFLTSIFLKMKIINRSTTGRAHN